MRQKLKDTRTALHLSLAQVADSSGITKQGYSLIEKGERTGYNNNRVAILTTLKKRRDEVAKQKLAEIRSMQDEVSALIHMVIDETLFEESGGDVVGN